MAQRRMFSLIVTDADPFLEMPTSAQALYFHLNMHADDDGFVGNARAIMRMAGCSPDDFKLLLAKQFLLEFESGVIVIRDWRVHNAIRKDRYKPTAYQDEFKRLAIASNGTYTLTSPVKQAIPDDGNQMATSGKPDDNQMEPQVRLGKVRLGKVSQTDVIDRPAAIQLISYWEDNISQTSPTMREKLEDSVADFMDYGVPESMAEQLAIKAAETAIQNNARNKFSYFNTVTKSWAGQRYTSVADVDAADKARKASQQPTGKRNGNAAQHDVYHDHRLDDDFQAAIDRMAANGKETATDPENDPLPY